MHPRELARCVRRVLGVAMACSVLLGVVASAQAAFPGKPGLIVFSSTFAGNREIFVAAADGSGRVDLTRDPHVDVTPSWSADGKRIVFASDRSGAMEIYVMGADGSGVAQVTHDGSFADHPRFTADGRSIVYESKKGGNWEIRRIGADGGGEVNLTRNRASDRYPAVSPNGRLVAFASNRGTSGTHIWVMNIQGGALKQVTLRKGNQFNPTWAPAGGRLAYVSGTLAAGTNIRTVLANGKGDHALTALHADEQVNPSWSPDAHSIVYEDCQASNTTACTLSVHAARRQPDQHLTAERALPGDVRQRSRRARRTSCRTERRARRSRRTGESLPRSPPTPCRAAVQQPHQRGLVHEVQGGRRLRRAGRLPVAGMAGRKRSFGASQRRLPGRASRRAREPDLGRAIHGLDIAGRDLATDARHDRHATRAARGRHCGLLLSERLQTGCRSPLGRRRLDPATLNLEPGAS